MREFVRVEKKEGNRFVVEGRRKNLYQVKNKKGGANSGGKAVDFRWQEDESSWLQR